MNKKRLIIVFIICIILCTLSSIFFRNKVLKRSESITKEQQEEKERYENTLKQDEVYPVLILKKDKLTVYKGDEINFMSFVSSATDNLEGDLIKKVKVNPIDTNVIGEYYVEYEVSDSASNITKARMLIIVKEKPNFKY